ncbi:hypothetical protein VTH06DRAFT_3576 [Thermothelomyces fergusii]
MGGASYVSSSASQGSGPVRAVTHTVERAPQSPTTSVRTSSGDFAGSGGYDCDSPTSTSSTAPSFLSEHKNAIEPVPTSRTEPAAKKGFGKVNAHSYCGRHSKQFLFGGKGFHDLWRAVKKKK